MLLGLVALICWLQTSVHCAPGGGLRKRMQEDMSPAPPEESHAPSSSSARSIRRRVGEGDPAQQSAELPLVQSLKRDWAAGTLTAKQVQDYAAGAEAQGALGVLTGSLGQAHEDNTPTHPSHLAQTVRTS